MSDFENNKFNSPLVKLKQISPLAWGFFLVVIAGILVLIPFWQGFFRTLALLPLVIGGLMIYQAIYHNKY
jgi:fatty acid desaturase